MKKLFATIIIILASVMGLQAQVAQPTLTTLSSAMTVNQTTAIVVSATSFLAGDILVINHEAMQVASTYVSGTTIPLSIRGYTGTYNTGHVSGAYVMRFTPSVVQLNDRFGSCTRATQPVLPVVSINRNKRDVTMYDCNGGAWYEVTLPDDRQVTPIAPVCNIPIGSVAYASVGTNTTDVTDKSMRTTIMVDKTVVVTGIQVLQGGTATTDNITAGMFDSGGKLVANTAVAGVLLATANTFKNLPFTAVKIIPGPARYWIAVIGNGTTAGAYQTVPTLTFKNLFSGSATGQTFGTFPEFTPATTFTADLAPVVCLYN